MGIPHLHDITQLSAALKAAFFANLYRIWYENNQIPGNLPDGVSKGSKSLIKCEVHSFREHKKN